MKDLKMILFLLIIFSLCTLLLTGAQTAYDKASAVINRRLYGVILELYQIDYEEETVEETFNENFEIREVGKSVYYISKDVHKDSVVFKTTGPGLWNIIEVLLAVDKERETLLGLRIIAQAETPGLGGRISELPFQERFQGVDIRPELKIVKFAVSSYEVDAVSGATKTSKALEKIINNGIKDLDQVFNP